MNVVAPQRSPRAYGATTRVVRTTLLLLCLVLIASASTLGAHLQRVHVGSFSDETVVRSGLPTGALVAAHGLSLHVPPAGQGVGASVLLAGGGEVSLSLQTGSDGTVILRESSTSPGISIQPVVTTNPCADGYYKTPWGIRTPTYSWWFASASTPSNVSVYGAETGFRNGVNHITNSYNNCGLADNVSATNAYQGRTSSSPNIYSSGGCSTSDGKSVVGFGTLPNGYLGYTCWWANAYSQVTSADVKLNKYYYRWYHTKPLTCTNMWSIDAVSTHEFGHVFGLDTVSEYYHPSLTMSMVMRACQNSESTLGLGDVRGLNSLY
jgi:hypothetical protein